MTSRVTILGAALTPPRAITASTAGCTPPQPSFFPINIDRNAHAKNIACRSVFCARVQPEHLCCSARRQPVVDLAVDQSERPRRLSATPMSGRRPTRFRTSGRRSIRGDPLYRFHQWKANWRILNMRRIKTVPSAPRSHPVVERLIGMAPRRASHARGGTGARRRRASTRPVPTRVSGRIDGGRTVAAFYHTPNAA